MFDELVVELFWSKEWQVEALSSLLDGGLGELTFAAGGTRWLSDGDDSLEVEGPVETNERDEGRYSEIARAEQSDANGLDFVNLRFVGNAIDVGFALKVVGLVLEDSG